MGKYQQIQRHCGTHGQVNIKQVKLKTKLWENSEASSSKKKKAKLEHGESSGSKQNSYHSNGSFNLKALSGSSGYKFGVLAKIVNYMETRHQRGDTHPLTLE